MQHARDIKAEQLKQNIIEQKREKLFRNLALIHSLSKIIEIAYFDSIKDTNFRNPKIKAKADMLHRHSEDIIKSLGDAVKLKEDMSDFMEYDHFVEVFELLRMLVFVGTDTIKVFQNVLNGSVTEQEIQGLIRKE